MYSCFQVFKGVPKLFFMQNLLVVLILFKQAYYLPIVFFSFYLFFSLLFVSNCHFLIGLYWDFKIRLYLGMCKCCLNKCDMPCDVLQFIKTSKLCQKYDLNIKHVFREVF